MHKEKYILADMQIIEFENEDVITTSVNETVPDEQDPIDFYYSSNEIEIV